MIRVEIRGENIEVTDAIREIGRASCRERVLDRV